MSAQPQEFWYPNSNSRWSSVESLSHVELIRHCVATGDEAGWNEFVRRFNRYVSLAVVRTLVQRGGRRTESLDTGLVEDLVQDVYVRILESSRGALRSFRGSGDAAVFLYIARTAMSVVVDFLRRQGARKRESFVLSLDVSFESEDRDDVSMAQYLASSEPSPEERAIESARRRDVADALARVLKGRNAQRDLDIAQDYLFADLTIGEIAVREATRMRESSVKSSLVRTSAKLREEFARRERRAASNRATRAAVASSAR